MMDELQCEIAESCDSSQEGAGLRFLAHGCYF